MKFVSNKKYATKYYNKIKKNNEPSAFEEKYIKLYETEDISEFEQAFNNSSYIDAKGINVELFPESIGICFNYDLLDFDIEIKEEKAYFIVYDPKELVLNEDYEQIFDINSTDSIYEILSFIFKKLDEELKIFRSSERKDALLEEMFDKNKLEKAGKKSLTRELTSGLLYAFLGIFLIASSILYIKSDYAFVMYIVIAILSFIMLFLAYNSLSKYSKLRKFIKNISSNEKIKVVSGTPSKVVIYTTSNRSGVLLDYITITIDGNNYLACMPEPISIYKKECREIVNKLHEKKFTINYYENSKIIDLKSGKLYEEIMKAIYENYK